MTPLIKPPTPSLETILFLESVNAQVRSEASGVPTLPESERFSDVIDQLVVSSRQMTVDETSDTIRDAYIAARHAVAIFGFLAVRDTYLSFLSYHDLRATSIADGQTLAKNENLRVSIQGVGKTLLHGLAAKRWLAWHPPELLNEDSRSAVVIVSLAETQFGGSRRVRHIGKSMVRTAARM